MCDGPAACYDFSSAECNDTLFPKRECCPSSLPYCRDCNGQGLGCFASDNFTTSPPFGIGLNESFGTTLSLGFGGNATAVIASTGGGGPKMTASAGLPTSNPGHQKGTVVPNHTSLASQSGVLLVLLGIVAALVVIS